MDVSVDYPKYYVTTEDKIKYKKPIVCKKKSFSVQPSPLTSALILSKMYEFLRGRFQNAW